MGWRNLETMGYAIMSQVNELNLETQEIVFREYTEEELQQRENELSATVEIDSTEVGLDPVKVSALNKLKSLGLTDAEARAIAGI